MTVNRALQVGAPHGTRAGYVDWRCGCFACRYWKLVQQRRYRGEDVPDPGPVSVIQVGDEVRHPHLGWGRVVAIDLDAHRLTVAHRGRRRTASYRTAIILGHRDRRGVTVFTQRKLPRETKARKLLPQQATELRLLRSQGWYYRELSERFGVSTTTARRYARR